MSEPPSVPSEQQPSSDDETIGRIKQQFKLLVRELEQLPDTKRARLQGHLAQVLVDRTISIDTPRGALSFVTLGRSSGGRGVTMLTKQPATIAWIDQFRPNSVFWDVGANVGVYALYAARGGDTTVVAFEPAAVNYFLLSANCEVNRLDEKVRCLLVGLGREPSLARLEVSQFATANSFSFLGKQRRPFGGRQSAFIMTIDQLVEEQGLECPNYIKIDVPGLSGHVLSGGARTLRRPDVRELHIELKQHSSSSQRLIDKLKDYGLILSDSNTHGSTDLTFVRPGT